MDLQVGEVDAQRSGRDGGELGGDNPGQLGFGHPGLGGLSRVDVHGHLFALLREIVGDAGDLADVGKLLAHGGGGLGENPLIRGADLHGHIRAHHAARTGGHGDLLVLGQVQVLDVAAHPVGQLLLVQVRIGDDGEAGGIRAGGPHHGAEHVPGTAHGQLHVLDALGVLQQVFDLFGLFQGGVQCGAGRHLLGDLQGVLPGATEQVGVQQRGHGHGAAQDQHRDQQGDHRVLLGAAQHRSVAALHRALVLGRVGGLRLAGARAVRQEPVGQHRHNGQRHQQRSQQGNGHGQRERAEQLPGHAGHQRHRQEHCHGGQGRRGDRPGDLAHRQQDRLALFLAVGQVALDVLNDHNRVIHHAANGDGQRAQGEHVQGVAEHVHPNEGDHQRQRNGDRGDQGGADGEQEDQDHQHREDQAEQALGRQRVDGLFNEGGLVEDRGDRCPVAQFGFQLANDVLHRVGDPHGVPVRGLGDGDRQGFGAVGAGDAGGLIGFDGDLRDVLEQHRAAVGGDGDFADFFQRIGGRTGDHRQLQALGVQRAHRHRGAGVFDRVLDVRGVQSLGGQLLLIGQHQDVLGSATGNRGIAYPVDLAQLGQRDALHIIMQFFQGLIRSHGQVGDWQVGDRAGEGGRFHVLRQLVLRVGDRALHLRTGPVHVRAVLEHQ